MPLIPNYITRFRTRSQSTGASSSSTAPSLDPPTPAAATHFTSDAHQIVSSLSSSPNGIQPDKDADLNSALPLPSGVAVSTPSAPSKRRKARSLTLDDTILESGGETEAITSRENGSNFISRILSSYSNTTIGRKRSFTLPLTGVASSQTPINSPSESYHTPANGSSPEGSAPSSSGGHKRSSFKETINTQHVLPKQESQKRDCNTSRQHITTSRNSALSGAVSHSGKDAHNQGQSCMTEASSPLVTAHAQTETFFTPPRTSTPPPQRSPNSYRGRQPSHTYPPRSRSRHTFDGGTRPAVLLSEGHGSPVLFPSFRRMSESLNKIIASPSSPGKSRKEAHVEDVFTDTQNKSSNTPFVLSGQRRLSADWSSIEVIRGDSGGAESWPSSVSREMVRLSLKDGSTKSAGNNELGSTSSSDKNALANSDIDLSPKNPTLFGSVGEDRRAFFRAGISTGQGRRGHKVRSSLTQLMTVMSGSATAASRNNDNPTDAHSNVSESRLPVAARMTKGDAPTLTTTSGSGGNSIPYVSVTAPTPVEPGLPYRLSFMSDPGPGLGSDYAARSKRKIADAEDEPVSSSLTASASAPLNGYANKNSVRSILLSRRESVDRPSDASHTSHAPSSFRQPQAKRIRLSDTPPPSQNQSRATSPPRSPQRNRGASSSPSPSRPGSALRTGAGSGGIFGPRTQSQASSNSQSHNRSPSVAGSTSIPVLAILTPRAPSIDTRHSLNTYHMRDPSLPPSRRQSAVWKGAATRKVVDEDPGYVMRSRSSLVGWGVEKRLFPLQGWAFIVGFVVFPLWWVAAICPATWGWGTRWKDRRKGYGDPNLIMTEEELRDREILEYDVAYTWRQRCRLMSLFGLFVYVPLIVLIAVLVPRSA